MIVHAGCGALLLVAGHGMRGHGDDGQVLEPRIPADDPRGGVAVHHRHLDIHQHGIVAIGLHRIQGFLPVAGQGHDHARTGKDFHRDLLVELVVFNEQNPGAFKALQQIRSLFFAVERPQIPWGRLLPAPA